MTTVRKEPRRVRRARNSAAFHARRANAANGVAEDFQAAEYALRSAAAHTRKRGRVRELRRSIVEHVRDVLDRAEATEAQRRLYAEKLAGTGSEAKQLSAALMCLRGALGLLDTTERDQAMGHYTTHFRQQASEITGGVR